MADAYAGIILKQNSLQIDRVFDYRIPEALQGIVKEGTEVLVPFGHAKAPVRGYCVELREEPEIAPERLKDIAGICENSVPAERDLIRLASWMQKRYGSTMIQALLTCLPVKEKVRGAVRRTYRAAVPREELEDLYRQLTEKHRTARARAVQALLSEGVLTARVRESFRISSENLHFLETLGVIECEETQLVRDPYAGRGGTAYEEPVPTQRQRSVIDGIDRHLQECPGVPCYLQGVTGSGKTLVYTELIAREVERGRQAIFLIPEISLTYQTVQRFKARFGDRAAVLHSRLSAGERYDQLQRALRGEIDVMIGPRSALFTPMPSLGLIIMDEEHEDSYKSETAPRYHAREAAACRAHLAGAGLVLGSATPSVEAWQKVKDGSVALFTLPERAVPGAREPDVTVTDMREELKAGNRSILSRALTEKIRERLERGEQTLLFLNRRGYAGFLSCRSCGQILKCPHCDISLTLHGRNTLRCHICGFETPAPRTCPSCGSPFIAAFGAGTQKVEEEVRRLFPDARTLRMDLDTTSGKEGHEKILRRFEAHEADILVGTQMIVKGHDFPLVTLVGAVAADLSLAFPDYRAAEKTYQLLVQAIGRAGRARLHGEALIQTYQPEHFAIRCAASSDYEGFFAEEIAYRRLLHYPPAGRMMTVQMAHEDETVCETFAQEAARLVQDCIASLPDGSGCALIGPASPPVARKKDIYYRILTVKGSRLSNMVWIKDQLTAWAASRRDKVSVQFDIR